MNLRSLECLCEIVASGFNLSRAAHRLCASQPAVTRQVQLLEEQLGFKVLLRRGNRIVGLTKNGQSVHETACRVTHDVRQLEQLNDDAPELSSRLAVATTHFHARYTLLPAIRKFRISHPNVTITILSGDPSSIAQSVSEGRADFGLSTEASESHPELVSFPCYEIRRVIIVPRGHPLTRARRLSLKLLARHPLIVYDRRFSSGGRVLSAFERQGIRPNIVLSAIDVDVLKAYVAAGLGVAIIQELAFDPARDTDIEAINADSLFEPSMSAVTLRKDSPQRGLSMEFLRLLAPLGLSSKSRKLVPVVEAV